MALICVWDRVICLVLGKPRNPSTEYIVWWQTIPLIHQHVIRTLTSACLFASQCFVVLRPLSFQCKPASSFGSNKVNALHLFMWFPNTFSSLRRGYLCTEISGPLATVLLHHGPFKYLHSIVLPRSEKKLSGKGSEGAQVYGIRVILYEIKSSGWDWYKQLTLKLVLTKYLHFYTRLIPEDKEL